jgi:hypothetical protein
MAAEWVAIMAAEWVAAGIKAAKCTKKSRKTAKKHVFKHNSCFFQK